MTILYLLSSATPRPRSATAASLIAAGLSLPVWVRVCMLCVTSARELASWPVAWRGEKEEEEEEEEEEETMQGPVP